MRTLRVDAAERPAPNPLAKPRRRANDANRGGLARLLTRAFRRPPDTHLPAKPNGRKRTVARRRPLPRWLRPALTAAAAILALASMVGGGWWIWHSGRADALLAGGRQALALAMSDAGFTVQEIDVQGRDATAPDALLAAVGAKRGSPILFFDADAARERIEQIGWVKAASVQRVLPRTILIRIVERRPFARWQIDGRTVLIDRDGKVLEEGDPADFRQLRRVVGPGAADHAGELFDTLTSEPALFARVRDATRVRDRRWDVELDNGVIVYLPEQAAEVAWRHLAIMDREQRLLEKAVIGVDLRLPDRTVVRLSPEAAAARRPAAKASGKST